MKVLQINSVCGIGSTGRIVTDLATVLNEEGHECLVAYGRGEARNWDKTYKICSDLSNKIQAAGTRLFDNHGLMAKNATKKLVKKIEEFNPDIIHLHNLHGYYINYEILCCFLERFNKPIVWTLHDCWAFTGHCAYFDFVGCEKWKTGCSKCINKKMYPQSLFLEKSKQNYFRKKSAFLKLKNLTIVTPSVWLAEIVKQSFLSEKKIEVINNGIDLDLFKATDANVREKYKLTEKGIVLGVASAWGERKGYKDFWKIADILGDDYQIVLVGLTKSQMAELPKNIKGIMRTESISELASLYTAAHVFVNPTYEDNFPTVNLEALACGTPVITYNTGGSVESIYDGCGSVVEKGNINQLVDAIKNTIKTIHTIKTCLEKSKRYDKKECFNKYLEVYK